MTDDAPSVHRTRCTRSVASSRPESWQTEHDSFPRLLTMMSKWACAAPVSWQLPHATLHERAGAAVAAMGWLRSAGLFHAALVPWHVEQSLTPSGMAGNWS